MLNKPSFTIFIAIPSYLDLELKSTILDGIKKATYPSRLHFGICLQWDKKEGLQKTCIDDLVTEYNVSIDKYFYRASDGVGWARNKAQQLYNNETYFLQIDAHTRFIGNWDELLIDDFENLKKRVEKPIISYFPPAYRKNGEGYTFEFSKELDKINIPAITNVTQEYCFEYIPHNEVNTGFKNIKIPVLDGSFIFTDGNWAKAIMQDPAHYYLGEEVALSLRSFTAGFDFYTPKQIVAWHGSHRSNPRKHYEEHAVEIVQVKHQMSVSQLKKLVEGKAIEEYGLNTQRTLQDYQRNTGIDILNRQVDSSKVRQQTSSSGLELVKFYLFEGNLIGEKKYVLYEGVINNPKAQLVNTIEASDYILVDFRDIPNNRKTIEQYHYKTIVVDYSDDPTPTYDVPCWKYFKRSVINKKDLTFHTYDREVFPIAYCIKTECLEFEQVLDYSRNIDIAVFFETKGDYHHYNRSKIAAFIKENFGKYNIHVGVCGENGEVGRSSIQKEYYDMMFHSKIVITCNPDNWEGDYRTFEAFSTGTLVMVDQMKTPKINPFVDGKHIVYYDRENLEELKKKVEFYLQNDAIRTKIAQEGYFYALQYHKASDRINEILSVISSNSYALGQKTLTPKRSNSLINTQPSMQEGLNRIPTFIPGSKLAYDFPEIVLDGVERFPYAIDELGALNQEVPIGSTIEFNQEGKTAQLLEEVFIRFGSDKSQPHNYHYVYGELLHQLGIDKELNILEIGIGTNNPEVPSNMGINGQPGASLRAFREVLKNSRIYGADVDSGILFNENKIRTAWVNQLEPDSFIQMNRQFGNLYYDLIIDDGLHSVTASLNTLLFGLKVLKTKGWIVIEDIWAGKVCWKTVYRLLPAELYNRYILKSISGSWLFLVQKK